MQPRFALSRRMTPTQFVCHRGRMQPTSQNAYGLREVIRHLVLLMHPRFAVLSDEPDTIPVPSGENATDLHNGSYIWDRDVYASIQSR